MQREMLSVETWSIIKTLTLIHCILMNMKFHHTKLLSVLFHSGESKKDDRENRPLFMDKLHN